MESGCGEANAIYRISSGNPCGNRSSGSLCAVSDGVALCSETPGDVEDSGCTWNGEEADVPDTDL